MTKNNLKVVKTDNKKEQEIKEKNKALNAAISQIDYEYTRGELYSLIDKGQEAVQGALEVAQESGHPRAYEVAVAAMKHVADMTDKLADLHKKMKDLDAEQKGPKSVLSLCFLIVVKIS